MGSLIIFKFPFYISPNYWKLLSIAEKLKWKYS